MTVASTLGFLKMSTDSLLRGFDLGVIAVVQNHQLNITADRLDWVIIGTALRQSDPMQFQLAHQSPGLAGFTRVCRITIQRNPD